LVFLRVNPMAGLGSWKGEGWKLLSQLFFNVFMYITQESIRSGRKETECEGQVTRISRVLVQSGFQNQGCYDWLGTCNSDCGRKTNKVLVRKYLENWQPGKPTRLQKIRGWEAGVLLHVQKLEGC
jgi:hypothetical protein